MFKFIDIASYDVYMWLYVIKLILSSPYIFLYIIYPDECIDTLLDFISGTYERIYDHLIDIKLSLINFNWANYCYTITLIV